MFPGCVLQVSCYLYFLEKPKNKAIAKFAFITARIIALLDKGDYCLQVDEFYE